MVLRRATSITSLVAIRAQKSLDFQGPPLQMLLVMDFARLKTISYRAV